MSPAQAAEEAVFLRLGDAALTEMLGAGVRLFLEWPADSMQATDFPRITIYSFGPPPLRPGVQRVRVTLDLWVWPSGVQGRRPKLLAMDGRILELFDEQEWSYGDHWIYSTAGGWRDFPGGPGKPMRRMRELTLDVSALATTQSG